MKLSIGSILAYTAVVSGHCIFQNLRINGQDQGSLNGLRAPNHNNPVEDVNSPNLVCGSADYKSSAVLTVPAGATVGSWWQHVLGGPQFPNDPDNPIAASHKGPVTAWLARVDDAVSASLPGLDWFKIAEDNLDTGSGTWGVDNMIQNNGWHDFTMPECIAPGQYLLRVEILALHSAGSPGGAQFYQSCAQIEVTGSGSFAPATTVKIPGVYSANDPSIQINVYGAGGVPNNDGKPYEAPGPRPISC